MTPFTTTAPTTSAPTAALDDVVVGGAVLVVSHLPSHPSLNSLGGGSVSGGGAGATGGGGGGGGGGGYSSSSASSVDGGATVSTVGTSGSKRTTSADAAAVHQKVQDTWRVRREERDQREIAKRAAAGSGAGQHGSNNKPPVSAGSVHSGASAKPPLQHNHHNHPSGNHQLAKRGAPLGLPMLCAMVQKGWKDAFDKPKPKAKKPDRPRVFPSMLSILEANALVTQVRNLQEEEDDDDDDDDSDDVSVLGDSTRGADSPRDQAPTVAAATAAAPPAPVADPAVASVLSILPAGYDWNKAILQMAQSRSRAFLLLDLAAIVRRTVLWKRAYPGVTWVHSVSANANPKLLQVLLMAGVRLATTTRSDLAHALDAQSKLKKPMATALASSQNRNRIADSTARSAPPDSYIRELLNAKVFAITVDGADEVHRVVRTVQRMQARHGGNSHGIKLELTLQLHPAAIASWLPAAKEALAALEAYPVHELSGMSLDVGGAASSSSTSAADILVRQVEAERVKDLILKTNPTVKIHLTGFEGEAFPEEWVSWWAKQRSDARVREVSVECSIPLIASAGALCTRIIGVRANVAETKQQLYIDDGCYGSLYQTKGDLHPIPLGNYGADPAAEQVSYTTTVWGPTCDGLDRVCRDIPLPKLERDEWVVFPNLGCPGAQGTAFNGFEPPDTAYCVLGYFK